MRPRLNTIFFAASGSLILITLFALRQKLTIILIGLVINGIADLVWALILARVTATPDRRAIFLGHAVKEYYSSRPRVSYIGVSSPGHKRQKWTGL